MSDLAEKAKKIGDKILEEFSQEKKEVILEVPISYIKERVLAWWLCLYLLRAGKI